MPILGRTLRLNTSLSVLHMEACQLSGKALFVLIAALKVSNRASIESGNLTVMVTKENPVLSGVSVIVLGL